jgi:hypothetical protein
MCSNNSSLSTACTERQSKCQLSLRPKAIENIDIKECADEAAD